MLHRRRTSHQEEHGERKVTDDHRFILVVLTVLHRWWLQTCLGEGEGRMVLRKRKGAKERESGKKEEKSKQGQLLPPASSVQVLKFASQIQKYFGSHMHTCMHI